ncbi:MAG: HAD family hydrolase [Bacteroidales bacterium]|nr:HAD family hydrolase [Bacteroidales bacterium]
MEINSNIKIIAFDADDTLWVNEPYYRETERAFTRLLTDYLPDLPEDEVSKLLFETETRNIELYGYGVKGFVLSMIETALKITNEKAVQQSHKNAGLEIADAKIINQIIELGKALLHPPMVLLDGVSETLERLNKKGLKLVLATKGDLLDQERKLKKSGLAKCFHHIEIMSNKNEEDYQNLLKRLEISSEEFLMVGNSIKSDILPVLSIGAYAIHIPYHTNWAHEMVINGQQKHERFLEIKSILELFPVIEHNKNAFFDALANKR